ncbi:hypothetical protein ACRYCC_27685 [Actinomadura scrupuli]|uniref:hypothetical protein n=1 Tax=Actinomadura scrupuli TaxID=559629 RepID=UPI003D95D34F
MKRLSNLAWSVCALILVCLLGAAPASASGARETCDQGLAALQRGDALGAQKIYAAVRPPKSKCAIRGLDASTALIRAEKMVALGMRSDAEAEIEQALKAEPTLRVPDALLPQTIGRPGVRLAKALERAGYHKAAVEVLRKVIEHDPGITLDAKAKEILHPPFHRSLLHAATRPVALTVESALALLVISLLLRMKKRLHIQPFLAGFQSDPDDPGAIAGAATALRALIRAELHRLADQSARMSDGRRLRLDQAGPYEDRFKLGTITDSLPHGKLAGGLINLLTGLMGSRARLVNGTLLPDTAVVLTLDTVNGRLRESSGMIKAEDIQFPPSAPESYLPLALPAAAWIILTYYPADVTLGGTRDWNSYIAFAAGYAWQERGNLDRARALYAKAAGDPRNHAATVNLAALEQLQEREWRRDDPRVRPSARRLQHIVDGPPDDLHWYRAQYLLSLMFRDAAEDEPRRPPRDGAAPASAAGTTRLTDAQVPWSAPPEPLMDPMLDEALRREARLHAMNLAVAMEEQRDGRDKMREEFFERSRAAALTLLARQMFPETSDPFSALDTRPADEKKLDVEALAARLKALRDGGGRLTEDGMAEAIVEYVRTHCTLDDQARYNLMFYHRTRARSLEAAITAWQTRLEETRGLPGVTPGETAKWRREVRAWQSALEVELQEELDQFEAHRSQIMDSGSPDMRTRTTGVVLDGPDRDRETRSYATIVPRVRPGGPPPDRPNREGNGPSVVPAERSGDDSDRPRPDEDDFFLELDD